VQFVQTHQATLARKPFAAFLVCMTMSMKNPNFRQGVAEWLKPVRALVRPASEGYFAGALNIRNVPSFSDRLKFRISVALGVWSDGDHRDWDAIRAWAQGLIPILGAYLSQIRLSSPSPLKNTESVACVPISVRQSPRQTIASSRLLIRPA
jgi:hypothetical protein